MASITKSLLVFKAGAILLLFGAAAAEPYRIVVVEGGSMLPTYSNHSVLLATRRVGELFRGEVVVVNTPSGTLIKRIAYLPGDRLLQMNAFGHWTDVTGYKPPKRHAPTYQFRVTTIPPNQVYVLGDDRTRSVDSRDFGPVAISAIIGSVLDQRPRVLDPFLAAYLAETNRKPAKSAFGTRGPDSNFGTPAVAPRRIAQFDRGALRSGSTQNLSSLGSERTGLPGAPGADGNSWHFAGGRTDAVLPAKRVLSAFLLDVRQRLAHQITQSCTSDKIGD